MREAFFYTRQCCRTQIPGDELISLCYRALVECAKNYKPNCQRFFAYSKINLRGHIYRYWKNQDVVKNSSIHEVEPEQYDILKQDPLEYEHDDRANAFEGNPGMVTGVEESRVDPDFDGIHFRERLALVKKVIAEKLTAQEQMIIELTYNGGYNFEKIGQMLEPKVSRSAVQQTCAHAIKKVTVELRRRKQLF